MITELERLRGEASMAYRLTLVSLAAVTEDGYSDSGAFGAAVDTCDGVIAAEGDFSVQQWQDVARHLALVAALRLRSGWGQMRPPSTWQSRWSWRLILWPSGPPWDRKPRAVVTAPRTQAGLTPHRRRSVRRTEAATAPARRLWASASTSLTLAQLLGPASPRTRPRPGRQPRGGGTASPRR
jgi:hypothetical protein